MFCNEMVFSSLIKPMFLSIRFSLDLVPHFKSKEGFKKEQSVFGALSAFLLIFSLFVFGGLRPYLSHHLDNTCSEGREVDIIISL